jgi:hypothetical protein
MVGQKMLLLVVIAGSLMRAVVLKITESMAEHVGINGIC